MVQYWFIRGDFLKERVRRIGASDIPALIPNPEKPTESLAGYGRTPITVWQEKTGRRTREPAGIAAEMGHYLEAKSIEFFIRDFYGDETAKEHMRNRQALEFTSSNVKDFNAGHVGFQQTPFYHHTQFYRDGMIVHADAVYDPPSIIYNPAKITKHGITADLTKPFVIEAKYATYWAAKRPEGSVVTGYDFKLNSWQGVPMKHYIQIQFQLALLEIDTGYLALCYPADPKVFFVWQIRANAKHQGVCIDLAGKLNYHIEHDTPPGDLAMNAEDIIAMYPTLGDDFVIINGEERDKAVEIARTFRNAEKQLKRWGEIKKDALDAMAVLLKDRQEIRDGEGPIGKWRISKGYEKVLALSKIKAEYPLVYRYLKRKEVLETTSDSRTPAIAWKGDTE